MSDLTPTTAPELNFVATRTPSLPNPTDTPLPLPTPTVTSVPLLTVGEGVQWDGLSLSITNYEVTHTCPDGYDGQSAEGARFIVVYVTASNISSNVLEIPSLRFRLNGYESGLGAGLPCRYNEEAFGNACWQWGGELYPDVTCKGWELFEVPENLALEGSRIQIQKYDSVSGQMDVAEWLLEGQ